MKNTIKLGLIMMALMLATNACDVMEEPFIENAENEKDIKSFVVGEVTGVIDANALTVTLDFPEGTDVSHLTPTIEVSRYATIQPESGVTQDFTQPVYYTVTAFNGSTAQYCVNAVVHAAENEKAILSFRIGEVEGEINETAKTVTLTLPEGSDVTALVPTIEVSEGATVDPASGVAQDFTEPVDYTVTAQNGTTAVYVVTVHVAGGSFEPTGKTVLIKDFTGARCSNCPAAAEYAHNLQHQLDEDHIFIMSVHAGFLAMPLGNFPDFLTDEGTQWYNNNTANPLFSVDHVSLTDGNTLNESQLDTPVSEALAETQTFEVVIESDFDASTRQLRVGTKIIATDDYEGELHVTVCLLEDGIVGRQAIPGGAVDTAYVFRNVFRGTLNGADGEPFASGQVLVGDEFTKSHVTTLDEAFDADKCFVMAYVNEYGSGKILQTAMAKIR